PGRSGTGSARTSLRRTRTRRGSRPVRPRRWVRAGRGSRSLRGRPAAAVRIKPAIVAETPHSRPPGPDAATPPRGTRVSAALADPADALGSVFERDAFRGELVADGVGAGEVAVLLGLGALVHERLDTCVGVAGHTASEPRFRCLLQQAEREPSAQQRR